MSCGCTRPPPLGFSHAAKKEMAGFARKTSRKTTKGHFWQTFSSARRNAYGEEAVPPQDRAGVLGIRGAGGQVPHMARAPVWFTRAISFTERTAFPATATLTRQVTLPGGGAYGEMDSLPKVSETNGRCTYTQGEDLSWPRGQGNPQGADGLQAPCFVQAHNGEQCSHRNTGDTWWLTARPHYVACLLLGSLAEPSRDCEPDPWSFSFPPS